MRTCTDGTSAANGPAVQALGAEPPHIECFPRGHEVPMTRIEMALLAFRSFNAVRVLAYFPRWRQIIRDTNGATAVSYWTWGLFAASHLSTVAYALVALRDWQMVTVFAVNAVCCICIILLTFHKRREHRRRCQPHGDTAAYKNASFLTGACPLEPHEN